MATFDFSCSDCGVVEERWTPMAQSDEPQFCGECMGDMKKLYNTVPGIAYKGALFSNKQSFHDHSVGDIRSKVESSEAFKSGKIQRKSNVRWI